MYGNTISISKIVNGISKTLNIANELIPLYQKTKTIIGNAKKVINAFSSITNNTNYKVNKKNTLMSNSNTSNPVFFL